MIQIEKIKAEISQIISRRLNLIQCEYFNLKEETNGMTNELVDTFVNFLQVEPVSEDLEKELINQMNSIYPLSEEDDFDDPCLSVSNAIINQRIGFKKGFKAGANWQKYLFEKKEQSPRR